MSVRKRVQIKKLKGKSTIDLLFEKGKVIKSKRLILLSIKKPNKSIYHSGVSVPKKLFKKAVDRNRIKRQMRVAIAKLDESKLFEISDSVRNLLQDLETNNNLLTENNDEEQA